MLPADETRPQVAPSSVPGLLLKEKRNVRLNHELGKADSDGDAEEQRRVRIENQAPRNWQRSSCHLFVDEGHEVDSHVTDVDHHRSKRILQVLFRAQPDLEVTKEQMNQQIETQRESEIGRVGPHIISYCHGLKFRLLVKSQRGR